MPDLGNGKRPGVEPSSGERVRTQKHRDRGRQAGANAYLSKPYKESELIDEIRQLLKNKADQHE